MTARPRYVVRTFAGLPGECDWVALREFVPAGIAPVTLQAGAFDGAAESVHVSMVSVLPGIAPALRRDDGDEVWVAAQVTHQSADPSRDFCAALGLALDAAAGESVVMAELPGPGPRLQDVVAADSDFTVRVLDGFDFWFDGVDDPDGTAASTLETLNASIDPSSRLSSVDGAFWTAVAAKEHLRWVMPYDEEALLTALARLHVAGADRLTARLHGSSGPSARMGCWSPCGISRPAPEPTRSRSRPPPSGPPRRRPRRLRCALVGPARCPARIGEWPTDDPLTDASQAPCRTHSGTLRAARAVEVRIFVAENACAVGNPTTFRRFRAICLCGFCTTV